ncbi:hypothetical protein HYV85_04300, partial [Candidatus Woesearchaeota archaeon]|nr:hypothetical protein [Candidatus Woesearchaeota archaeon]
MEWKGKQIEVKWRLRHKEMLIVFTGLDMTLSGTCKTVTSQRLFMGFGYNTDLGLFGERIDILNFFSWMKRLQERFSSDWIVYDASGYYIVNRTPQKRIASLGDNPSAGQILDVLVTEQDSPKRDGMIEICELRSAYLKRASNIAGIPFQYIDSRKVFREERDYETALGMSLEFVQRLNKDNPDLVSRVTPAKPTPANILYLPLEIAEAFFLRTKFGVNGKFGPKTEEPFDSAILQLAELQEIPFM